MKEEKFLTSGVQINFLIFSILINELQQKNIWIEIKLSSLRNHQNISIKIRSWKQKKAINRLNDMKHNAQLLWLSFT